MTKAYRARVSALLLWSKKCLIRADEAISPRVALAKMDKVHATA